MSIFKNKCFKFIGKYNKELNIENENKFMKINEYINKRMETNLKFESDIDYILEYYIDYYEEVNVLYQKINI